MKPRKVEKIPPRSLTSLPLKNGGWKEDVCLPYWEPVTFQGRSVNLRGGGKKHRSFPKRLDVSSTSQLVLFFSMAGQPTSTRNQGLIAGLKGNK